jgi:hypothetical protein
MDKHVANGYTELISLQIAGREVILAENGGETSPFMVCECRWDNPLNIPEYYNAAATDDYLEAVQEFANRITDFARQLETEREKRGLPRLTLTAGDCVPGGMDADMTGKIVVVKPETLTPEYRISDHQLGLCTGGNGARPEARGRAVFFKNLYTGAESRYERQDIAGVIDPEKMPAWARERLERTEPENENSNIQPDGAFVYGGYHFIPYRRFRKGETDRKDPNDSRPHKTDARYAMRNMRSDMELGLSTYDWQKAEYSHDSFYAASGDNGCDIFRCVENGKLYVPGENELFEYSEPRAARKTEQKPSILSTLEDAKKQSAQRNAERAQPAPRRGNDMEV